MISKTKENCLVLKAFLLFVVCIFSTFILSAREPDDPKTSAAQKILDINDLDKWESTFGFSVLSNDGKWLIYSVRKNSRETEIRLHNLINNKVTAFKEGSGYKFSEDNKWLGFMVSPDFKTLEKLREEKKPVVRKFGLVNLTTDETIYIDNVDSFDFSGDGRFLAIKKSPANSETRNANIIVRDLAGGKDRVLGNVKEFDWSDNGSLLAFVTDLPDRIGNSVTLFDGKTQSTKILDAKEAVYSSLAWRKNSEDLAVLRSFRDKSYEEENNEILIWRDSSKSAGNPKSFKPVDFPNFPADMKIPSKASFQWSLDGNHLFFGIDRWKKSDEKKKTDDKQTKENNPKSSEIPALEIWNTSDVLTVPEQKVRLNSDLYLSVWNIDSNNFVQLDDKNIKVRFQNDSPILLGLDANPYEFAGMFGRPSSDVYSIDVATGTKKKILTDNSVVLPNAVSPGGRYFVYLNNNHIHLYDFAAAKDINLTKNIDDSFVNLEDDHPVSQKPPFGVVGWDETGKYFVAHSKFDVWRFDAATGKSTGITIGKAENIEHRYEKNNFADRYVDLNQPFYIRRFGNLDKKSGYFLSSKGGMRNLYWGDGYASGVTKAKNADTFALKIESYNDSPDYFVLQNGSSNLKQISNLNPFEKDYKSGKAEVISYKNAKGQDLQGSLYYPDDYVPGKKYPMITYIYELLSNGFHRHAVPSNSNYYNRRVFTSQGYFVFMPDIVFEPGNPGVSSVKTLEIAVKAVVDKGLVDEKRIGLVGHSWGGYQAAYAVTGTNIFAAAVAGAGISNLLTMYGTLTPSFGNTFESMHFEVGQERMIVPPWKDIEGYLRNSAIPNISKMQTPLLMEVGDADTNVNWGQGLEMYNAARREKKPMVLLVYAKEGHGLSEPKNQTDYQRRILDWFGHYLKNEPAKRWIKENISYEEQQKLLKERSLE